MRGVMERQTNQYDLYWWRESACRLGCERGCGLDVPKTSAGMMTLPTPQNIRWPLSDCTKGVTVLLLGWQASPQSSQQHSGGLKFMGCKDKIHNLLYTNAGSIRTVGALFFRHILGTFASEWMIEPRVAVPCICGFTDILRSWSSK